MINIENKELLGVSVVMDYRKGYPQPKAVPGFDWKLHDRRQRILDNKKARCWRASAGRRKLDKIHRRWSGTVCVPDVLHRGNDVGQDRCKDWIQQ